MRNDCARMRWGLLLAAALALWVAGETVWGWGDGPVPRRGEVVIRPTGRRVRVVAVSPAAAPTRVRVMPAALTTMTTAASSPAPLLAADDGLEYTERGVRLPLAYDPRDNFGYGMGPVEYCPSVYVPPCLPAGYCGAESYAYHPGYGHRGGRGYGYGRAYNSIFSSFDCLR